MCNFIFPFEETYFENPVTGREPLSKVKLKDIVWISAECSNLFFKHKYRCALQQLIINNIKYYLFICVDEKRQKFNDKVQQKKKSKNYMIRKIKLVHYHK